jgi:hypothetical protein
MNLQTPARPLFDTILAAVKERELRRAPRPNRLDLSEADYRALRIEIETAGPHPSHDRGSFMGMEIHINNEAVVPVVARTWRAL